MAEAPAYMALGEWKDPDPHPVLGAREHPFGGSTGRVVLAFPTQAEARAFRLPRPSVARIEALIWALRAALEREDCPDRDETAAALREIRTADADHHPGDCS